MTISRQLSEVCNLERPDKVSAESSEYPVLSCTLERIEGGTKLKPLRVGEDIQPVSAFRSNAAKLIGRVQASKRALVLTQHGRSAAVVLDAAEYDRLMEELELLRDIHLSNSQIAAGKSVTEARARKALLGKPKR
jgi:antitoxin YefM